MATLVMVDGAVFGAILHNFHDRLTRGAEKEIEIGTCTARIRHVRTKFQFSGPTGPTVMSSTKTYRQFAKELLNFPDYADVVVENNLIDNGKTIEVSCNVLDCPEESAFDFFLSDICVSAEAAGVDIEEKVRSAWLIGPA